MGNVMVIPAKRQVGNTVKQSEQKKLRVAAYCRVSTDSEEQETSYEAQVTHYTEYIQKNPDWELAGIFADDIAQFRIDLLHIILLDTLAVSFSVTVLTCKTSIDVHFAYIEHFYLMSVFFSCPLKYIYHSGCIPVRSGTTV